MKAVVIAALLAALSGCAQFSESVRHPFAASGGSTSPDSQAVSPYPYNSPYGN
jgi:hypothetical protein